MSWDSMGFDDEAIELAYDKTVVKCKELKWAYMNKILMSWYLRMYAAALSWFIRPRRAQV